MSMSDAWVPSIRVEAMDPHPTCQRNSADRRPAALERDPVEDVGDLVGVDGTVDFDGQTLPRELVDDIEQLDLASVGGGVELEVHCPHHVRADR